MLRHLTSSAALCAATAQALEQGTTTLNTLAEEENHTLAQRSDWADQSASRASQFAQVTVEDYFDDNNVCNSLEHFEAYAADLAASVNDDNEALGEFETDVGILEEDILNYVQDSANALDAALNAFNTADASQTDLAVLEEQYGLALAEVENATTVMTEIGTFATNNPAPTMEITAIQTDNDDNAVLATSAKAALEALINALSTQLALIHTGILATDDLTLRLDTLLTDIDSYEADISTVTANVDAATGHATAINNYITIAEAVIAQADEEAKDLAESAEHQQGIAEDLYQEVIDAFTRLTEYKVTMDVYLSTITTNSENTLDKLGQLSVIAAAVDALVITTNTYEDYKEQTEYGAALYEEIASQKDEATATCNDAEILINDPSDSFTTEYESIAPLITNIMTATDQAQSDKDDALSYTGSQEQMDYGVRATNAYNAALEAQVFALIYQVDATEINSEIKTVNPPLLVGTLEEIENMQGLTDFDEFEAQLIQTGIQDKAAASMAALAAATLITASNLDITALMLELVAQQSLVIEQTDLVLPFEQETTEAESTATNNLADAQMVIGQEDELQDLFFATDTLRTSLDSQILDANQALADAQGFFTMGYAAAVMAFDTNGPYNDLVAAKLATDNAYADVCAYEAYVFTNEKTYLAQISTSASTSVAVEPSTDTMATKGLATTDIAQIEAILDPITGPYEEILAATQAAIEAAAASSMAVGVDIQVIDDVLLDIQALIDSALYDGDLLAKAAALAAADFEAEAADHLVDVMTGDTALAVLLVTLQGHDTTVTDHLTNVLAHKNTAEAAKSTAEMAGATIVEMQAQLELAEIEQTDDNSDHDLLVAAVQTGVYFETNTFQDAISAIGLDSDQVNTAQLNAEAQYVITQLYATVPPNTYINDAQLSAQNALADFNTAQSILDNSVDADIASGITARDSLNAATDTSTGYMEETDGFVMEIQALIDCAKAEAAANQALDFATEASEESNMVTTGLINLVSYLLTLQGLGDAVAGHLTQVEGHSTAAMTAYNNASNDAANLSNLNAMLLVATTQQTEVNADHLLVVMSIAETVEYEADTFQVQITAIQNSLVAVETAKDNAEISRDTAQEYTCTANDWGVQAATSFLNAMTAFTGTQDAVDAALPDIVADGGVVLTSIGTSEATSLGFRVQVDTAVTDIQGLIDLLPPPVPQTLSEWAESQVYTPQFEGIECIGEIKICTDCVDSQGGTAYWIGVGHACTDASKFLFLSYPFWLCSARGCAVSDVNRVSSYRGRYFRILLPVGNSKIGIEFNQEIGLDELTMYWR